ncbi:MAG: YraN family protein [Anaerolineaceae bacterium]|nr:YraN family protein [Anaerolineaceae bacterium]
MARKFLESNGYKIIDSNVYTPYGELDIIASRDEEIVFVEVKTRTTITFGFPEDAITNQKIQHIIESAQAFLQENPDFDQQWRIDVIAIEGSPENKSSPKINWYQNAVQ